MMTKLNIIFNKYLPVLLLLILFILVYHLISKKEKLNSDLQLRGDTTICITTSGSPLLEAVYTVNDVEYNTEKIRTLSSTYQAGEKFKVVYDRNNPRSYKVLFHLPVYSVNNFGTTQSNRILLSEFNEDFITFYYEINGKEYERGQRLMKSNSKFNERKRYTVYYNRENPKIAYLSP